MRREKDGGMCNCCVHQLKMPVFINLIAYVFILLYLSRTNYYSVLPSQQCYRLSLTITPVGFVCHLTFFFSPLYFSRNRVSNFSCPSFWFQPFFQRLSSMKLAIILISKLNPCRNWIFFRSYFLRMLYTKILIFLIVQLYWNNDELFI